MLRAQVFPRQYLDILDSFEIRSSHQDVVDFRLSPSTAVGYLLGPPFREEVLQMAKSWAVARSRIRSPSAFFVPIP